ncbi:MAG: glycosyltransferase family 2 protein [Chitinispirillales bacterium]|nr:glycosyltransferase family 2 protein [Chitinispirillales bacterium]
MESNIRLSFVIPCFNEETTVRLFYDEAMKCLESMNGVEPEFIFVDDGSTDNTLHILQELAGEESCVHYLSFSRNFGKEAAMLAGLRSAGGEVIVTMDVDGQDPLSLVPEMFQSVTNLGYDCAATRRVNRIGEPPVRSFLARCFYSIMKKITDVEVVDGARDFRLMNRKYLNALLTLSERSRFSKGIFPWLGFKTKWFEYENIERNSGKTKWSFWKLFLYSLDGIIAFSTKPLAVASICGFLLFLASIAGTVIVVIRKLVLKLPDTGWSSLVCIILFVSGIQLFTTGILGQYLAKIYIEIKQRPHYIIREHR